jgi:hypothetical protein
MIAVLVPLKSVVTVYLTLSPQIIQSILMSYSRTLTIVYFTEEYSKAGFPGSSIEMMTAKREDIANVIAGIAVSGPVREGIKHD